MGSLSNLATGSDVVIDEKDTLGGFTPLESALYKMTIDLAFLRPSPSGAIGLNMHYSNKSGDSMREILWIVSGDAKGNNNFYVDRNGDKRLLPGMQIANAITQLTLDKDIGDLESEEKVISLYDPAQSAEAPTSVQMIMDLLGKEVILGVKHNIVDKNVKDTSGNYVPSGDIRHENTVDRVFSADTGMTVAEKRGGNTGADFIQKWEDKWKGVTTDKSTKNVAAPVPGGAPGTAGSATQTPTKSLFG